MALLGGLALGASSCGSKTSAAKPADPVTSALQAPGTRTVVIPKQHTAMTIVVPPCSSAELKQDTTKTPPGSNQIVVPNSSLDQTVAVQPCMQGAKNVQGQNSVLLGPGGTGSPTSQQNGTPQNQLILPKNANLTKILVPPCVVTSGSSGSSGSSGGSSGGSNTVLPAARGKTTVTAPPCKVQMTSSSSS
ncbi:MAG TPA: hypothetical protein VGF21_19760 [Thermoleophilaceae bacterium]|jgi:hypothetical protein